MSCAARIRRAATDYFLSRLCICIVGSLAMVFDSGAAGQPTRKNDSGRLLIASDVHFNPMADPGLVADLAVADPSQWEAILQRSKVTAFSPYGQDPNWWLLRSGLDAMVRAEPHPALVMFTGDLLAHNFRRTYTSITHDSEPQHYRAFVLKTFDFIALEFRKRFAAKILLTPGNNDTYCSDYGVEAHGAFLDDTEEGARELALEGEQFNTSWKSLGSYSLNHPTLRGLRIVSLNTVFWSAKYRAASFRDGCAPVASTAASDLLTWLESQLADAESSHQKVWLMFHIPPGIDGWATTHSSAGASAGAGIPAAPCASKVVPMWAPEWTARFESLLERYHGNILASFAGHTHSDDFRLIGANGANKQFVLIDPAISPIYDQNPGFRIVDFRRDGTLADQTTYFLTNLMKAGAQTPGLWRPEYRFSQRWKVRQLDGASLAKVYDEIAARDSARNFWWQLYMVSSSAASVPATDVRGMSCAIGELTEPGFESCVCAATARGEQAH